MSQIEDVPVGQNWDNLSIKKNNNCNELKHTQDDKIYKFHNDIKNY